MAPAMAGVDAKGMPDLRENKLAGLMVQSCCIGLLQGCCRVVANLLLVLMAVSLESEEASLLELARLLPRPLEPDQLKLAAGIRAGLRADVRPGRLGA